MVGTLLGGRHRLEAPLGDGAVASVWRARDEQLGVDVAVKLVHPHLAHDPAVRERVRREAVASRRVPGAVGTWEVGEDDDHVWLVQELCPGGDLAARAAAGPVSEDQVVGWGVSLAATLQAAHDAGVLHRDLKPENLLLDAEGHARVGDFGLARLAERAGATATSMLAGSVGYAAPEIYDGVTDDPRSDQYALAATLAELALGRRVWRDAAPSVVMKRQQTADAPPLDGLSPALASVLRRALSRRPDARFATMQAFGDALLAAGQGQEAPMGQPERGCAGCGEPLVPGLGACPHCGRPNAVLHRTAAGPYRVEVYGRWPGMREAFTNWPGQRGSDWLGFQEKKRLVEVTQAMTGDATVADGALDRALRRPAVIAADGLDAAGADSLAAELGKAGLDAAVAGPDRQVPWAMRWRTELLRWLPLGIIGGVGAILAGSAVAVGNAEPLAGLGPLAIGATVASVAVWARRPRPLLAAPGSGKVAAAPIFAGDVVDRFAALRAPDVRTLAAEVLRGAAALRAALGEAPDAARRDGEAAVAEAVDAALSLAARLDAVATAPVPAPRRGEPAERVAELRAEAERREEASVRIRGELLRIAADLRGAAVDVAAGQAGEAEVRARGAVGRLRSVAGALAAPERRAEGAPAASARRGVERA